MFIEKYREEIFVNSSTLAHTKSVKLIHVENILMDQLQEW